MKQLKVYYTDNTTDIWSIPVNETPEESVKGIEEDTGLEIAGYDLLKGYN